MRLLAATCLLVSLVAVSGATANTPAPNVKGTVIRSSGTAGCTQGEPCDPLPPAIFIVFSRGSRSTRARLAVNGAFSVRLAPGRYAVSVAPPTGLLTPASIAVPRVGTLRPRLVEQHR